MLLCCYDRQSVQVSDLTDLAVENAEREKGSIFPHTQSNYHHSHLAPTGGHKVNWRDGTKFEAEEDKDGQLVAIP